MCRIVLGVWLGRICSGKPLKTTKPLKWKHCLVKSDTVLNCAIRGSASIIVLDTPTRYAHPRRTIVAKFVPEPTGNADAEVAAEAGEGLKSSRM